MKAIRCKRDLNITQEILDNWNTNPITKELFNAIKIFNEINNCNMNVLFTHDDKGKVIFHFICVDN